VTALPRKPGQAAASISYPVDFAMNSSRVWQTIADGARPCANALIGIPRIICVFDPAIRIAANHPLARGPGVESIPIGTRQNRSDNGTHISILQDDAP
jgi:hypothetical protein